MCASHSTRLEGPKSVGVWPVRHTPTDLRQFEPLVAAGAAVPPYFWNQLIM